MKKVFIPLMLCAAAFVGCSKDDVEDGVGTTSSSDLVSINVSSGTTRGTDTTTETLEEDGSVKLFIFDSDYVDGANYSHTFTYDKINKVWEDSDIAWSTIKFPATFLSMHDGETHELDVKTSNKKATLSYEVSGTTYAHKDLVYHASSLSAIPTGGMVNAYHKHALSKIHLHAATGGNKVYIARAQFVNVSKTGTVTINAVEAEDLYTTEGVSWSDWGSTCSYEYFHIDTYKGDDGDANGAYKDNVSLRESTADGSVIINDDAGAPFMMIPQETTAVKSGDIAKSGTDADGSYLEVIYYMTDANDIPLVGYSSISAHPNSSDYDAGEYSDPLYVMGAFPVKYDFEPNKEYDITLGLGKTGSTGGILLVDYYVNKDGKKVAITYVDEDKKDDDVEIPEIDPGDDILPSTNSYICITVSAHDWDDGDDISVSYSK